MSVESTNNTAPPISLHLFGSLRLVVQAQTHLLTASPVATLLGYLGLYAAGGRAVTRSRLAGTLFPDLTEAHARRSLSETLYRLRRVLGEHADRILHVDEDLIALERVWIDVKEFRAQVSAANLAERCRALDLYSGDLLEDLDADWVLGPRASLQELYLAALERTYAECVATADLSAALTYAHRWTLADPLREEAHRATMQLYARLGRHAAALQQFNRLTQLLADELQIEPLAATRALAESIRAEVEAQAQLASRHVFIGRRRERAMLIELAEGAQAGQGQLVLLEGEPGIGKTRLLEELADAATWRGLSVVWGRSAQLGGTMTPYAPLTDALQAALVGPRVDQVRARLSATAIQALAWLFPRSRSSAPIVFPAETQGDLVAALVECVRAIAELNPHVFILDDVHWASTDFWQVMPALVEQTTDRRLLWVLSYRLNDLRANSDAWAMLRTLDRVAAPSRITISGMTLAECAELARELDRSVNVEVVERLYEHTHGNPLFLHEALAQPETGHSSFQTLLEARLRQLPAPARRALDAGAVLGREFAHGRWQALVGRDLLEAIPTLVTAQFIQESERGYLFQHDLAREYVYQAIAPGLLRDLHRAAAEVLMREQVGPDELAWHFEQAEQWPEAVCYRYGAGDQAMKAYAFTTALEHYTHGLELVTHLVRPEVAQLALLCRRQRVLGVLLRMSEWRTDIEEIERMASTSGDHAALLVALEGRLNIQAVEGNLNQMQDTAARALHLARELDDFIAEARIAHTVGNHLRPLSAAQAIPYLERAAQLAEHIQDFPLLISALCSLTAAQVRIGRCATARASAAKALTIIEQEPNLQPLRPRVLHSLAEVSHFLAEWESAQSTLRLAMQQQYALKRLWEMGEAAFEFIVASAEMGQSEDALKTAEFVLSVGTDLGMDQASSLAILLFKILIPYTHLLAGHLSEAEHELDNLVISAEAPAATRATVEAYFTRGLLHLLQNRPEAAIPFLKYSIEHAPPELVVETIGGLLAHALAAKQINDLSVAKASLMRAEQLVAHSDVARYNVLLHYVCFQVSGREQDLQAAHNELHRQLAQFTNDRLRSDFIHNVYWHRLVEELWQQRHPSPAPLVVRLARSQSPLGKSLDDSERIDVQWTVDDGESDANLLNHAGKTALRHHRLRRLMAEAQAQGAAPSDADLARALGVSERTIRRDMLALKASGQSPSTRRRKTT